MLSGTNLYIYFSTQFYLAKYHSTFQYTMLSGKVPFQVRSSGNTADAIMNQIKGGLFDVQGPEWNEVSSSAKNLIKGMTYTLATKNLLIPIP